MPKIVIHEYQRTAKYFREDLGHDIQLDMISIPGGTFMMGSPKEEKDSLDRERPQHEVTVQPFFMGKYPVTQAQWRFVAQLRQVNKELDPDPSNFKGDNRPVERVSWYDAVEFCDRLSTHTKRQYRLPSEAEWEYACRAGTTTPFHFGETITTDLANYDGGSSYSQEPKGIYRKETTAVESFGVANNFGLMVLGGLSKSSAFTYQAAQSSFIFGYRYRHHRNRSGLFFDTPDEFPPASSGTEEYSPHHYIQPENQYCCCCCRGCCCCDKQNGNFQDCCSTNHRAAVKIAHPFSTLLSSQEW
jgi:hypothetical protein